MKSQNISCVFLNYNHKQMDLYQELRGRGQPDKRKNLINAPFFKRPPRIEAPLKFAKI